MVRAIILALCVAASTLAIPLTRRDSFNDQISFMGHSWVVAGDTFDSISSGECTNSCTASLHTTLSQLTEAFISQAAEFKDGLGLSNVSHSEVTGVFNHVQGWQVIIQDSVSALGQSKAVIAALPDANITQTTVDLQQLYSSLVDWDQALVGIHSSLAGPSFLKELKKSETTVAGAVSAFSA